MRNYAYCWFVIISLLIKDLPARVTVPREYFYQKMYKPLKYVHTDIYHVSDF